MRIFFTSFITILTFMACVLFASIAIHLETYTYETIQMLVRSGIVISLFASGANVFIVKHFFNKERKSNV
ncbi:hypothetical protein [Vibrio phage vB_VpaP_SJSY21]|nr:hypothetical protein [Vibrio phage vB_VpaP_SJSY21]